MLLQFELDIGAGHFRTPGHMPRLHLMTFNLKTGEASRTRVHHTVGDFPQSPGHLLGTLLIWLWVADCRASSGKAALMPAVPVMCQFVEAHFWGSAGRKTRYAYLATMPEQSTAPGFTGVTKLDLQANSEVRLLRSSAQA